MYKDVPFLVFEEVGLVVLFVVGALLGVPLAGSFAVDLPLVASSHILFK